MNFTVLSLISTSITSQSKIYFKNYVHPIRCFFQKFSSLSSGSNLNYYINGINFQNILGNIGTKKYHIEIQNSYSQIWKTKESECPFQDSNNNSPSFKCKVSLYLIYALLILIAILLISIGILSFLLCKKPKVQNFSKENIDNESDPILSDMKSNDDLFYVNSD